MNSQYVIIKRKNNFGNDPTIFDPVILPDIQPDIRFGHINEQISTKFGSDMYNVIICWQIKATTMISLRRIVGSMLIKYLTCNISDLFHNPSSGDNCNINSKTRKKNYTG